MAEWVGKMRAASDLPDEVDQAAEQIIGAAIEVYKHLGPGLLESVYERALIYELQQRGLTVHQQAAVSVS